MKWFQFDTIYVNGSSLSAGGGLCLKIIKTKYKELHNVTIENEKMVTYGKYVADYFNCNFINEAKSGAGAQRLIRNVYEYIEKHGLEKSRKTLFIFEIQAPVHRVDLYCEKVQDYLTVNVRYDNEDVNEISSIQIQDLETKDGRYYDHNFFMGEMTEEIKQFLEKHHNPIVYCEKTDGDLVGLFSYLNQCNINYLYMFDQGILSKNYFDFYKKNIEKEIKIEDTRSINDFCEKNKLSIKLELNGFTEDIHPGYFGNKLYSEHLIKFIEKTFKPKLYAFGDSFTQSFSSHFETNNPWAVNYKTYKKYTPKNYVDLISHELEIENVNMGKGGGSNYHIFDTFIEIIENIKEKDIIIFNWTSESRFRISDDVNNFVDIIPFNQHPSQNLFVSKKSTEEIGKNRITNNIWWKEILNFIKIIKKLLPKNVIVHWTWVDPSTIYQDDFWSDEMINDKKLCIDISKWDNVDNELKEKIKKCSDIIVDFSNEIDHQEMFEILEKYSKVVIINTGSCSNNNKELIRNHLRSKHFNLTNYKKICFNHFIKHKKYETISEETNNIVDDLHYSENGHFELYKDIMLEINNKKNEKNRKTIL